VSKTNLHYWLALKFVPRLAIHKKIALVDKYGISTLFSTSSSPLTSAHGLTAKQLCAFIKPDWQRIEQVISDSYACNSVIITFDDSYYPSLLKEIYDPPLVLFVQGNEQLLNADQVAIVGSRYASINGRESAYILAEQLVQQGVVITSGLALGIDAAAHKGALTVNSSTIAVVATGLGSVYPARHKTLAQQIIAENGAIISEFLPKVPAKAGHFPKRNRIISGLSVGVVVVEAAIKSGSLITARCALEQNREVFAVPSSINNPLAKGCHWLIKQGAKLVEDSADIVNELDLLKSSHRRSALCLKQYKEQISPNINDNSCEKKLNKDLCKDELLASVGFEITPVDKVVSQSKLSIEEVLTQLTIFELKGLVAVVPGGYLRLK